MLSSQHPEPPTNDLPEGTSPDGLDELITRARRLRDDIETQRRGEASRGAPEPRRSVWELALDGLDDVGERLAELRAEGGPEGAGARAGSEQPAGRVGNARWNLLTDGVVWSDGMYAIFGRPLVEGPLTLDQLPSWLPPEDQPSLTAAVTDCLVDGRPMDCEFRITRPDGSRRLVRMAGEPVLDGNGGTVAMCAMVRDLREDRPATGPGPDAATADDRAAGAGAGSGVQGMAAGPEPTGGPRGGPDEPRVPFGETPAGRGVAVVLEDSVLAPWLGSPEPGGPEGPPGSLELAARFLPAGNGAPMSGRWFDSLTLPDGGRLLTVGDLSGTGPAATAGTATVLGAVRGIALTGAPPGALLGHLNQLLDRAMHPALASVLCCRYEPDLGALTWSQAGHPAPLLCRDGTGWALPRPAGPLLGADGEAHFAQRTDRLAPGDVLVLHTDGLFSAIPRQLPAGHAGDHRLIDLAPRLSSARSAAECLRVITAACGEVGREDDACVLVARVRS
ncbi:SpoIIE family protein phosphatase [Streptomyces hainanensis]|uniref:Phosphatase n=1 Tax=Streptomyces hainanensis TaxID=402648 RepID=A0A4R4TTR6_9ACTN|nr:SpoIIE family protein phosphatase [Streptomyces hainanensis]TDC78543.1 phosphatase [Streptomyces hainanensis]